MIRTCLLLISLLGAAFSAMASPVTITEKRSLAPELEPFRPYIGKTYQGEFKDASSGKTAIDISQWERALNGQAIRILHSMNEGQYGGESIIFYDQSVKKIRFYYFTTAGFYTQGDAEFDGTTFISREQVTGNANGITEVRVKARFDADGHLSMDSEYLKGDTVANTSSAIYKVVTGKSPVFK
ncbi:hypothetical protein [Simiduia agarivorans]|uniref:Secreted protein n=1 Tax=Simiduia agarivorans (strain DSM 21679 / JCM 13881 / BCRC 17597 / SA1) TaxID=1117647 RepID=K4KX03_SIMAS|nr:hypothetical protein [Simiduia agarivorans]AFU98472.1 hypothetical protein M5M_06385 [Simiduia agarivorans SA1 = DSM 21679]